MAFQTDTSRFSLFDIFIRHLGKRLLIFTGLLIISFILPLIGLKTKNLYIFDKIVDILLIVSFAGILIALLKVGQDFIYHKYDLNKTDNLKERKIRTQLQFLRKIFITLIVVVTVCVILLSFESLRKIGTGLLTGVGVGGIIIGFAAQKSIANLLAGFQIAFTQPIRIDDAVLVEGEWGRIEEITLTYVVVNIWDQRRLILPINYFIEKPFQNWTRNSSELLGAVILYLDYTMPLDALRAEFKRLLEGSELWDRRVGVIQVTDVTEKNMQIRVLVSAASAGSAFDLRCYLRESLINFIQKNYHESLPKTRGEYRARQTVGSPDGHSMTSKTPEDLPQAPSGEKT